MGLRAYLLVDVDDDVEQGKFIKGLRELEKIPGIDSVDPVIGNHDVVIVVNAPVTVETIAAKVREKSWVNGIQILRIVSMFEHQKDAGKDQGKALTSKSS